MLANRFYQPDASQGTDLATHLFDTAIAVAAGGIGKQVATQAGNHISLSLHHQGAWPQALQYELDANLFRAAIIGFRTPDSEIGQRATGMSFSIWRPHVAQVGGRSAFAMHLARNPAGMRTLEFARTMGPDIENFWYIAPEETAHGQLGTLLMQALQESAPHRVIAEGELFMAKPKGAGYM